MVYKTIKKRLFLQTAQEGSHSSFFFFFHNVYSYGFAPIQMYCYAVTVLQSGLYLDAFGPLCTITQLFCAPGVCDSYSFSANEKERENFTMGRDHQYSSLRKTVNTHLLQRVILMRGLRGFFFLFLCTNVDVFQLFFVCMYMTFQLLTTFAICVYKYVGNQLMVGCKKPGPIDLRRQKVHSTVFLDRSLFPHPILLVSNSKASRCIALIAINNQKPNDDSSEYFSILLMTVKA